MKLINMPPDATALMESTRAIGYSLPTAVADIIDNSIAAEASRVEIFYSPIEQYVAILDDGFGMNAHDINRAMKYGGVSPLDTRHEKDLGRFGLGMKTASLSQCEVLTVVSKQGENISARRWDLNEIRRTNSWTLIELSPDETQDVPKFDALKILPSGTLVVWQELDRMFQGSGKIERQLPDRMDAVREHLSLVFHRYLSGEDDLQKFSILMNNLPVEPSDPFLLNRNTPAGEPYSIPIGETPIGIATYMLPYPSKLRAADKKLLGITADLQKNQGFYVYRNKRLIVWGTWFNRSKKEFMSQLARIRIDIPPEFDGLWVLDVKKSRAVPPPVIRERLDGAIENLSTRSKRTYTYRGRKETDKIYPAWNRRKTPDSGFIYEINEDFPVVRRLLEKFPACERDIKKLLKLIAAELPLRQLQIDLNNSDVEVENANLHTDDDIREILKIVTDGKSRSEVNALLDKLKRDDPYKNFPQVIAEFRKDDAYD